MMNPIEPNRTIPPPPTNSKPGEIIKYFTQNYPVDVVGIAQALGLNVWEDELPGLSGMVVLDPSDTPNRYRIVVNASDSPERKRFTTAHEVAHFLLHRNRDTKQFKDDRMYRSVGISDQREAEANRLAADILMPRRLIRLLLERGITDPEQMAKALKVSNRAMRLRLGLGQMAKREQRRA